MADAVASSRNKVIAGMNQTNVKIEATSSPPSGDSGDSLHDNESVDDERKFSNISPPSTPTLNFEDLNIHDEVDDMRPREHTDRFVGSFYGKVKHEYISAPAYGHHAHHRHNHRFNPGHTSARVYDHHSNAHNWISEETRAAQSFLAVRNSMRRMFKYAEVAKWKVADYTAHREAFMASQAKRSVQQARSREAELNVRVPPIPPQKQDMMRRCGLPGNFEQVGNYSRALGEKTIWCEDWQNGKDEIAPWPCLAEMKWEGDDRAKTGVGRYPPLPREQGPVGLPWNQLQAVEQYPLDQIARIPTMEDVYLPVDEIDNEVKYDLLNRDLEDAMDACLES